MKYFYQGKFEPEKLHPLNIDRQTISLVPEGCRVLEIGCADGFMGEYLIRQKKCHVVGVEIDKKASVLARKKGLQVINGDIENYRIYQKLKKYKRFKLILASSVIEHLKNPLVCLQQWVNLIEPGGFLVATVPNSVHWSARLKIILGKFEYEKYGIFDENHLHFFTKNTFSKLLDNAGYEIVYFSFDPVSGGFPKISLFLSKFFPNLFSYQFLFKAKVKNEKNF